MGRQDQAMDATGVKSATEECLAAAISGGPAARHAGEGPRLREVSGLAGGAAINLVLFVALLLSVGSMGCKTSPSRYAVLSDSLGLRDIVWMEQLRPNDSPVVYDTMFVAPINSRRYQVKVYFPEMTADSDWNDLVDQKRTIAGSYNGVSVTIVDGESVVYGAVVDTSVSPPEYSFDLDVPLSMWLGPDVWLERGRTYRLQVRIPSLRQGSSEAMILLGVGREVML